MNETRIVRTGVLGRPVVSSKAKRITDTMRERATVRLWRAAPSCVEYLRDVILGQVEFEEGKYKSAVALLARTMPTVSSQSVVADSTSLSANIDVSQAAILGLRQKIAFLAGMQEENRRLMAGEEDAESTT